MKRDLAVIRFILQKIEDATDYECSIRINQLIEEYVAQPGKDEKDGALMYASFKMLKAEKFILAGEISQQTTTGSISWETAKGITWRGYNLIDAIDNGRPLEFV